MMSEGGRYRVWIPPKLAYGARGNADGSVPPNSELVFTSPYSRSGARRGLRALTVPGRGTHRSPSVLRG
jgi:hypothetical protein